MNLQRVGPLISVITPCHNVGKYMARYIESLLSQTYFNLQLIFVNDGSQDNTEEIILSYKKEFNLKAIDIIYIYQDNMGLGAAINNGLKKVNGKYLCWADPDDYFEPDSMELRMQILEKNPEVDIVSSDAFIITENQPQKLLASTGYEKSYEMYQFLHLLNGNSFVCSGCYMVRTEVFLRTHPSKQIYPDRRGQNYQMLLPLYYKHKRYFLDKPLYNYVRHCSSMSHIEAINIEEKFFAYTNQKKTIAITLESIPMNEAERQKYVRLIEARFSRIIFNIAYSAKNSEVLKREYQNLRISNQLTLKLVIRYNFFKAKNLLKTFSLDRGKK
jgi:glycosyltransferase involved in cell wall biosynthesis